MAFHAPICATAGFKTSERINVTLALTFQMNQPINLSWFTGTDGLFPDRLPFYNPRPDPTPESDTTDRALSWFQENIGDAPLEPDESDLRLLKKMSAWHSASDNKKAKEALKDLLEEEILTDEEL